MSAPARFKQTAEAARQAERRPRGEAPAGWGGRRGRPAPSKLQTDAELGTLEYLMRLEEAGAAGECGNCGTFYARGAVFCARCGDQLLEAGDPTP